MLEAPLLGRSELGALGATAMKVVLAGAGAFALEVEQYILDCHAAGHGLFGSDGSPVAKAELVGLHFDGPDRQRDFLTKPLMLLDSSSYLPSDVHFLIAIGVDAQARRKVWTNLRSRGARFAKLVHPTSWVAPNARLGEGSIICPFAYVGILADLGRNVTLSVHASIGHDAIVGDHSFLSPYACIAGKVTLGEACFLGTSSVVIPQKTIGPFSKISAGAIACQDAAPNSLLIGNPAKVLRMFGVPDDCAP
jgi:sugar O-acyltransferase (sialic acid O-acetyltransferase NeuD family)